MKLHLVTRGQHQTIEIDCPNSPVQTNLNIPGIGHLSPETEADAVILRDWLTNWINTHGYLYR
jgi:hypothetical protein